MTVRQYSTRAAEDRVGPTGIYASVPYHHPVDGAYRQLRDVDPALLEIDPEVHRWPCLCAECIPLSQAPAESPCSPACTSTRDRRYEVKACTHRARAQRLVTT